MLTNSLGNYLLLINYFQQFNNTEVPVYHLVKRLIIKKNQLQPQSPLPHLLLGD